MKHPYRRVFYHSLIEWKLIDEITFMCDVEEHVAVREYIHKSLDVVVVKTTLQHLPSEKHADFLERVTTAYYEESLLEWLEEHVVEIKQLLRQALLETKLQIKHLLSET